MQTLTWEMGLRLCISNELPGGGDAAGSRSSREFALEEVSPGTTGQTDDCSGNWRGTQGCEDEWPNLGDVSGRTLQSCGKMTVLIRVAEFETRPLTTCLCGESLGLELGSQDLDPSCAAH